MRGYSDASELREKARGALKGRWLTSVVAALLSVMFGMIGWGWLLVGGFFLFLEFRDVIGMVLGVTFFIFGPVPILKIFCLSLMALCVVLLYAILVASAFRTGYYRFNLDLYSRSEGGRLGTVWFGFRHLYWKSLGTHLLKGFRIVMRGLGSCLLMWFFFALGGLFGGNILGSLFVLIGIAVLLWTVVRLVMMALDYAMAEYLIADRPDLSSRQILRASKEMMYGSRLRLLKLDWSFYGWILLAILVLGLEMFFLRSYVQMAIDDIFRVLYNLYNPVDITDIYRGLYGWFYALILTLVLLVLGMPFVGVYMNAAKAAFYREFPKPRV